MRRISIIAFALGLSSLPALASDTGLPTDAFVQSWTALPTSHFVKAPPDGQLRRVEAHAAPLSGEKIGPLLDEAFASANDPTGRRDLTFLEMTTSWDQTQRSALQQLRTAEARYAGIDEARNARFAGTLTRVVDGTGRSVATDESASSVLDRAYAAALARDAGSHRVAAEQEQSAWRTYRDAFAAFVNLQAPDTVDAVTAELDRQRARDLEAAR